MQPVGKYLVIGGLVLVFLGLILWGLGNRLNWFGHLPGDIRVEKSNFRFYAPLASMLILSILINFIIWLVRRFF